MAKKNDEKYKIYIVYSKKILLTKNNALFFKNYGGKTMAETMDKIIVIVGYLLAILIPILGLIAGVILYFVKKEDPFYQKHAKYIIIVAVVVWALSFIAFSMLS